MKLSISTNPLVKSIVTIVYVISILCVIILSIMYLQHSTVVPYPDAMLPMMKYEIAAWRLVYGLPFMTASCILILKVYKLQKIKDIVLVCLPAILCIVILIHYVIA